MDLSYTDYSRRHYTCQEGGRLLPAAKKENAPLWIFYCAVGNGNAPPTRRGVKQPSPREKGDREAVDEVTIPSSQDFCPAEGKTPSVTYGDIFSRGEGNTPCGVLKFALKHGKEGSKHNDALRVEFCSKALGRVKFLRAFPLRNRQIRSRLRPCRAL